jgi:molybdate transport system substrate-binding protein
MSMVLSSLLLAFLSFPPAASHSHSHTLTVAAAADLSALEPDLARTFYQTNPSLRLRWVNAASAILAQQITQGAPYDIFMCANAQFIDKLALNRKMAPGSVKAYAIGRLGMLWRDGKSHPISDLTQNWVRFLALPNPRLAPYGAAAVQALRHAGVWDRIQKKIVYAENVRETLEMFNTGNTDAVITAASLLRDRGAQLIPQDWHQPILQKAGIVAGTPNLDAAGKFMDFLLSPAAQAVFASFGFSSPASASRDGLGSRSGMPARIQSKNAMASSTFPQKSAP